jgi:penicillin G amidase
MSLRLRKLSLVFLSLLLVVCLVVAAVGYSLPRRSFPQLAGEIRLQGLNGPVEVYRDSYGIPHIYASSSHDLFFAQGYLHAQDRFWQMDFWRHVGSARLSELFGDSQLETDRFLRTLGWARVAQREIDIMDAGSMDVLQAYADGVNAYLDGRSGSALSLEHAVIGLINSSYRPEPWQVLHTLTYAKLMAWDLGGNMSHEIDRAILSKTLSPEQLADLYQPYPEDNPVIVPGFSLAGVPEAGAGTQADLPDLEPLLAVLSQKAAGLHDLLGSGFEGIGSNNWVVSGSRTATGMPLLANDTHLAIQMPSIWYEVGLHCQPVGPECPYNVVGFSFASSPGVIIGHNEQIAWGVTNTGPDVQDLYIERLNPANPNQYEVNGSWVDMEVVSETIQVSGGESVELLVRYTRHGPIISDVYGPLEDFFDKTGQPLPSGDYAIALRWSALEVNYIFRAVLKYNRASNWGEFREAMRDFSAPVQNFIYADVDGNIGYQTPGLIPIRANGDGSMPVPGWVDDYEWLGYIPFEELPYSFNPPSGYIVTANNAVTGPEYEHFISRDWDRGFRAHRVVDMIENAPGPLGIADFQEMHGDNLDLNAAHLVPVLLEVPLADRRLLEARDLLASWDYQAHMDSGPAALLQVFWKHLVHLTYTDDLPEDYPPSGGTNYIELTRRIAAEPGSPWWDRQDTAEVETRDQIFALALEFALDELEELQGKNPERWNWGGLHTATFSNPSLGRSGPEPIRALFNRGPFRTSGGTSIVNATSWSTAVDSYTVRGVPSQRMIVDLSDLSRSLATHTTGQSGHAYHPNYIDMVDDWRLIQYHPMLWDPGQVEAAAVHHLRLVP